jgi:ABC-type branched-subunit amino acid transport system permease subunit
VTGTSSSPCCRSAGLAAGLVAVPFGLIALRVRRHTFVVVTIAIFFIFQLMALQLQLHRRIGGYPRRRS